MSFDAIMSDMNKMNEEIEAIRKAHMETLQMKFKEATRAFFDSNPTIQAVVWSQYTPYFNDGEECIFSVNTPTFVRENFDEEDLLDPYEYEGDETYKSLSFWRKPDATDSVELNCYEFSVLIEGNDELMKNVFGDHVAVYLTRNKVVVVEYSHG